MSGAISQTILPTVEVDVRSIQSNSRKRMTAVSLSVLAALSLVLVGLVALSGHQEVMPGTIPIRVSRSLIGIISNSLK